MKEIKPREYFLRDDVLTYKKKYFMLCYPCIPYLEQLQIANKFVKVKV